MATRFLKNVCLLVAIVAGVEALIFFFPVNRELWRQSYLGAWHVKHARLVGPGENRLILAGGSNVAFGVDSARLQKVTQRETINLGLDGGVGLRAMLHELEDGVRDGDSVIFIPEYEHFFGDLMNGELDAANLVRSEPSALRYYSHWRQWGPLIRNSHTVTSKVMFDLIDWAKTRVRGRGDEDPVAATVYRSDSFNVHGDMVAHLDGPSKPDQVAASNGRIDGTFNQQAIEEIARFATRVRARGAEFVLVYPPVSGGYWARNGDLARQVADRMSDRLTVTKPEDSVFEDRLFYDTSYHLNRDGRALRTKQLIEMLKAGAKLTAS